MRGIARFISSVGFVGRFPIAPGTAGSFLACIAWYFIQPEMTIVIFLLAIFVFFFVGLYTSQLTENILLSNDPGEIVIDEWVGQWIALIGLEQSMTWGFVAFFIFRLFDIIKPYPINKLDLLKGGWGIMLDDVGAGIYTLVSVHSLKWLIG